MTYHPRSIDGLPRPRAGFLARAAMAALLFSLFMAAMPRASRAEEGAPMQNFDLPAGDAISTLKQFNRQSGVQLVYLVDTVRGIRTNAVNGVMPAQDALTIMLAGTGLTMVTDARSGALTIQPLENSPKAISSPGHDSHEIVQLNPFDVSAPAYSGYAASETMSGSRIAAKLIDLPESIDVVTRGMIDDMGWQDPSAFLPASTAAVSGYGIPSPNAGVYIRGFRSQNWSVDGATEASYAQFDNFNYNAFEIVKGPSALLFGPFGAFGGYVNMIPKYAGEPGEINQVQVTLGTSQYSSELIDVGSPLTGNGSIDGRLVLGEYDSNRPDKPGDFSHNHTLAPSITANISDKTKLKFRLDVESSHFRISNSAENAQGVVLRDYTDDGPDYLQPDLGIRDRSTVTQTILTSELSDEWSLKVNFMTEAEWFSQHTISLTQDSFTGLVGSLQYPQTTYQYVKELEAIYFHSWYGSIALNWKKEMDHGLTNDAIASGDIYSYLDDVPYVQLSSDNALYPQYNVPPYTDFNPSNPNYAAVSNINIPMPQEAIPESTELLGGINAMDTFGLLDKKLQLVLGVRFNYDSRWSDILTTSSPTAPLAGTPSNDVIEEVWLKRYGLVYQPTPQVSVYYGHDEGYLAVGVGFTPQGTPIQPESGKEDEVGVKTDLFHALGGQWSSTLAAFRLQVTNIAIADPSSPNFYLEEPAEKNEGIDAQLTYQSDRLSGTVGLYDADGPYNPFTNVRVPYAPKMTFVSWLKYNLTPAIAVGGGWRYQGSSLDGFSNPLDALGGYDTLSLFATYTQKLGKKKSIVYRLGMSNVTNATAAYMKINPETIYTEDGRETKLTATYAW